MKPLTPRERRLVAAALALGVVVIVVFGLGLPILEGVKARAAERESLRLSYARDSRLLATLPAWRAELLRQRRTARAFSLQAANRTEAESQLARIVTSAITDEGATTGAITSLPPAPDAAVGLRAEASLSYRQAVELIRRLENQEPQIAVDYASITAGDAAKTGRGAPLDVRLELSAAFTEAPRDPR